MKITIAIKEEWHDRDHQLVTKKIKSDGINDTMEAIRDVLLALGHNDETVKEAFKNMGDSYDER